MRGFEGAKRAFGWLGIIAIFLGGCVSQQDVDRLNTRFDGSDPLLIRVTVEEMLKSRDKRFVDHARRYLVESAELRQTPVSPAAQARMDGAIRVLVACDSGGAAALVAEQLRLAATASHIERWALALAGRMESPAVADALLTHYRNRQVAGREEVGEILLNRKDPRFLKTVRALTAEGDERSIAFVARSATASDLDLLLWCYNNVPAYRGLVADALGKTGDAHALEALLALAKSDQREAADALAGLAYFEDPRATATIERFLQSDDELYRFEAFRALARSQTPRAGERLAAYLRAAVEIPRAVVLINVLRDAKTPVAQAVLWKHVRERWTPAWPLSGVALVELGDADAKALLAKAIVEETKAVEPLFRIPHFRRLAGPAGIDLLLLVVSIDHENRNVILSHCRKSLSESKDETVKSAIRRGLKDPNPRVASACALWLSDVEGVGAANTLLEQLSSGMPTVRRAAVRSLGSLPTPAVKARLRQMLRDDSDAIVRAMIASSIGNWADAELGADLDAALKDRDANVGANALESLVKLRGDKAAPLVLERLAGGAAVTRSAALLGATALKLKEAVPQAAVLLADKSLIVRLDAISYFMAVPDDRAVEGLSKLLRGKVERSAAAGALIGIKSDKAMAALREAAEGTDPNARMAARYVLKMPETKPAPR